jgi:hypothetical protein
MSNKLNLDPNKAQKSEPKEMKEEDFAVVLVELLQNCGVLLGQIAESQAVIADCAKKQLELDIDFAESELDDDDHIEPIDPEIN